MVNSQEDLSHALSLIETALRLLDRDAVAATAAAHLDMARNALKILIREGRQSPEGS